METENQVTEEQEKKDNLKIGAKIVLTALLLNIVYCQVSQGCCCE